MEHSQLLDDEDVQMEGGAIDEALWLARQARRCAGKHTPQMRAGSQRGSTVASVDSESMNRQPHLALCLMTVPALSVYGMWYLPLALLTR